MVVYYKTGYNLMFLCFQNVHVCKMTECMHTCALGKGIGFMFCVCFCVKACVLPCSFPL